MSCCQPYQIKNPHYKQNGYYKSWKQYLEVPCGWCLNCRVDKQNWITDACEYEWKKFNYIGAFVTFTYDDTHLFDKSNILPDDFFSFKDDSGKVHVIPFINEKPAQYSLCRDDARDFLKRLRSRIKYLYEKNKIKDLDLCRKDFAFISAGEYGDLFGRPHYHFVFFGLDWLFCKELFEESWQQGLIDVRPIQDGAFSYVSKYFTKQLIGTRAKEVYDDNNLERPYFTHSLGLGKGLILEQLDYIKSHDGCYLNKNDIVRPIPIYYKNVLHLRSVSLHFKSTEENMINHCIKSDLSENTSTYRYSLKQMNEYKKQQSLLRHKKLENSMSNAGKEYEPLLVYKINNSKVNDILNQLFVTKIKDPNYVYHHNNFSDFEKFCEENKLIPF